MHTQAVLRNPTPVYCLIGFLALLQAACGSSSVASQPTPAQHPTPSVAAAAASPTSEPTRPIQVADFKVTAYQGDETFGGHDGHFAAAFAAGRPVVLLYYGGL